MEAISIITMKNGNNIKNAQKKNLQFQKKKNDLKIIDVSNLNH